MNYDKYNTIVIVWMTVGFQRVSSGFPVGFQWVFGGFLGSHWSFVCRRGALAHLLRNVTCSFARCGFFAVFSCPRSRPNPNPNWTIPLIFFPCLPFAFLSGSLWVQFEFGSGSMFKILLKRSWNSGLVMLII